MKNKMAGPKVSYVLFRCSTGGGVIIWPLAINTNTVLRYQKWKGVEEWGVELLTCLPR